MFVPVVDKEQNPLMSTKPSRARRWIKEGKATPFFKKGVFCVRLNVEPSSRNFQPIVVGIDPGGKKEGFSVKSKAHTYLNIEADAVTWVKDRIKQRKQLRMGRRFRKTPCRARRSNRSRPTGWIPPSTKARWDWKLRICKWLKKLYPNISFVVEDIKAKTKKGERKWNRSFSPLETGKKWFYEELSKLGEVHTRQGFETYILRNQLGLKKDHWIDAWTLAYFETGGNLPDNREFIGITPFQFYRRQLHYLQPSKGGERKRFGGTMSLGFKKGSLVKHPKLGICYTGGFQKDRITLHSPFDGERLARNIKPEDCKFLTHLSWRVQFFPIRSYGDSHAQI